MPSRTERRAGEGSTKIVHHYPAFTGRCGHRQESALLALKYSETKISGKLRMAANQSAALAAGDLLVCRSYGARSRNAIPATVRVMANASTPSEIGIARK